MEIKERLPVSRHIFNNVTDELIKLEQEHIIKTEQINTKIDVLQQKNDDFEIKEELQFSSFQLKFDEMEKMMQQFHIDIERFRDEYMALQNQLNSHTKEISDNIGGIVGSMSVIMQNETPIDVNFERIFYKDFLDDISFGTDEFKELFLQLVKNLDVESVYTITTVLFRLQLLQKNNSPILAIYSTKEKEIMKDRLDNFYPNILKLSDDCYFFKQYMLPLCHFEMSVFLDKCCVSYLNELEHIKKLDIIDAGAFIGDSALILSEFTNGTVHAFEPDPSNYKLMQNTLEMNKISNVITKPYALGKDNGKISLSTYKSASTQFANDAFEYDDVIDVDVITLDSYVRENNLSIGLIKADIEGAEQLFLQGAIETIKKQKPALLISIYHNADDFFKIKPMIESWDLGYRFKIVHPICGTVLTETILIAEIYEE